MGTHPADKPSRVGRPPTSLLEIGESALSAGVLLLLAGFAIHLLLSAI